MAVIIRFRFSINNFWVIIIQLFEAKTRKPSFDINPLKKQEKSFISIGLTPYRFRRK